MSQAFGARVRAARQAAGLSQTALAGTLMSASYLSLIEAGRREPSEAMVAGLAQRLCLPASALLGDATLPLGRDIAHLRILVTTGDYTAAEDLATRLLAQPPGHWIAGDAAAVLHLRGLAREGRGDLDSALEDLLAARLGASPSSDASSDVALALDLLRCLRDHGDIDDALREAEALASSVPDALVRSTLHAKVLASVIDLHCLRGDFALAHELAQSAVAEFDSSTGPSARAMVLWSASLTAEARGDVQGALRLAEEASELIASSGERRLVGQVHVVVAGLCSRITPPDLEAAEVALAEAETAFGLAATPLDTASVRSEQARVACLAGDLEMARAKAREALAVLAGRHPAQLATVWLLTARLEARARALDEARAAVDAARAVLTVVTPMRAHATAWRELADTFSFHDFPADAVAAYQEALAALGIARSNPGMSLR